MQEPLQFYETQKAIFKKEYDHLNKRLNLISKLRLFVFFGTIAGIYIFFNTIILAFVLGLIGISLFLFLLVRYTDLQKEKEFKKELIEINETEIRVLIKDFYFLDEGNEFSDVDHPFSFDIDLFGKGSFFQYLNRTVTNEGKIQLAKKITNNDISSIPLKQEAIEELTKKPEWRQEFSGMARLTNVDYSAKRIVKWIHDFKSVFPKYLTYVPLVFSLMSTLILLLTIFEIINFQVLVVWFFIGLTISGIYIKKVNLLYSEASKAKDTFRQYYKLLEKIEIAEFNSKLLRDKQRSIQGESSKASQIFAKFSKTLDALDQRNNILIAIVANGILLRDIKISIKIEGWINNHHREVENWFEAISFFDAQNSLANYAFNNPNSVYPSILSNDTVINALDLGHPLINIKERISNDFFIKDKNFFIITGANMAGKSTFLRTVSMAIAMANTGLPVCAKKFQYRPVKLITSMRTSDSLTDDSSYFFSELKRLKFIVDSINPVLENREYFIVLDEILKGTNSTDKAIGSKKFLTKLVSSQTTGIIATHDLSLCEIEKSLSQIKNYFFDAEIIDDELHFDYKLKKGVCKNMNASFLLRKMEII